MRALAIGLALALSLPACAWQRTSRLGGIAPWPPAARIQKRAALALRIYGNMRFEGVPGDIQPRELAVYRDEALRAYRESGLFSKVEVSWEPADIIAEIAITQNTGAVKQIPQVVSAIPFRETDVVMRTRFRRPDGSLLRLIDLSEAIRTLRLLVPPTTPSESSLRAILYDLHRATLSKAAQGGVLDLAAAKES